MPSSANSNVLTYKVTEGFICIHQQLCAEHNGFGANREFG